MYLILKPQQCRVMEGLDPENFNSDFTTDIYKVSEYLKKEGVRIFKIDSLTEIKDIKISFEEVTKEME